MFEPILAFLFKKMEAGAGMQKPAVKDVATIPTQAIKSRLTNCDDTDTLAFLPDQLVFGKAALLALESIQCTEDSAESRIESTKDAP